MAETYLRPDLERREKGEAFCSLVNKPYAEVTPAARLGNNKQTPGLQDNNHLLWHPLAGPQTQHPPAGLTQVSTCHPALCLYQCLSAHLGSLPLEGSIRIGPCDADGFHQGIDFFCQWGEKNGKKTQRHRRDRHGLIGYISRARFYSIHCTKCTLCDNLTSPVFPQCNPKRNPKCFRIHIIEHWPNCVYSFFLL